METWGKKLAGAALAGMLMTGAFATPAVAHDDKNDKYDREYKDERKNYEVDVIVKYKKHGHWKTKEYEDVRLKRAASIANDKCGDDDWREHFHDAKYTDRTGKTVKTCHERWVKVYFEQDEDDYDHDHDDYDHKDSYDKKKHGGKDKKD